MRLKVAEMFDNMSIISDLGIAFSAQVGEDDSTITYLENIEKLESNEKIREFVLNILDQCNKNILVLPGWIFSEKIYDKIISYYEFELNNDDDIYTFIIFNIPLLCIVKGNDIYKRVLSSLKKEQIRLSSLNVNNIVKSNNGVLINYYTHSEFKEFQEKPLSVQKLEQEIKDREIND